MMQSSSRTSSPPMRGTGLRIGELRDLELDCIIDYGPAGSWLRVPLGKLNTERAVPLDQPTLDVLDGWLARRRRQRPLPHPRDGRLADFVFVERGRHLGPTRLSTGLRRAAAAAGLAGSDGQPLHVVSHQLRHTYATICETCPNFTTAPQFVPAITDQLADIRVLRDDADDRGWTSEATRHQRVITSLEGHLRRIDHLPGQPTSP